MPTPNDDLQDELDRQYLKQCLTCKKWFMPKVGSQVYCSNACKMKAYRNRKGSSLNGLGRRSRTVTNTDLHKALEEMHGDYIDRLKSIARIDKEILKRLEGVKNWQLAHFIVYGIVELIKTPFAQSFFSKKDAVKDLITEHQKTLIDLVNNRDNLGAYIKANPKAYQDLMSNLDSQIAAARNAGDLNKVANLSQARETAKDLFNAMLKDGFR